MVSIMVFSNVWAAPKNNGPSTLKILICGQSWVSVTMDVSTFPCLFCGFGSTFAVIATSLIRFTNRIADITKPISTAVVKFTKTVRKNVTKRMIESVVLVFTMWANTFRSLIFHATTIKMGAILASGIYEAFGAKNSNTNKTTIPWIMPEKGETAPFLIFVAVLANAPVAGIPP